MSKEMAEGEGLSHQEGSGGWFPKKDKEEIGAERAAYYAERESFVRNISDPENRYRQFIDLGDEESNAGLDPAKSFKEATVAAREIKNIDTSEKALCSITESEVHLGLFPVAKRTAGTMRPTFYRDRAFGRIAVGEAELYGIVDYDVLGNIARKSEGEDDVERLGWRVDFGIRIAKVLYRKENNTPRQEDKIR